MIHNDLPENIFYEVMDFSNTIIIILDHNFCITYFNQRAKKLLLLNEALIIGKNIFNLPQEWSISLASLDLKLASINEKDHHLPDIVIKDNLGRDTILGLSIRKMELSDDKHFYTISGQDITLKRSNEAELLASTRYSAIGELSSGIAHDLSSPLQFISSNIEFIRNISHNNSCKASKDIQEAAEESLKGIKQAKALLFSLKSFVHPQNTTPEIIDIEGLVNDSVSLSKSEWKKTSQISIEILEGITTIRNYSSDISRVLINLIINASQAIEYAEICDGKISIRVYEQDQDIIFEVSDNGPGIPEQIREQIFDPFFTTKPKGIGSGQGLAISKSIICCKCHGNISHFKNSPSGCVFKITIPEIGEDNE